MGWYFFKHQIAILPQLARCESSRTRNLYPLPSSKVLASQDKMLVLAAVPSNWISTGIQLMNLCGKKPPKKSKTQQITHSTTTKQAFEEFLVLTASQRWKYIGPWGDWTPKRARCFFVVCDPPSWAVKKTSVSTKDKQHIQRIQHTGGIKTVGNWEDPKTSCKLQALGRHIPIQAVKSHKLQESKPKPSEREPRNTRRNKRNTLKNKTRPGDKRKTRPAKADTLRKHWEAQR